MNDIQNLKKAINYVYGIRMQSRSYGKTENLKRQLSEIILENLRLQNSFVCQPGSIGVKIGLIKLRGLKR